MISIVDLSMKDSSDSFIMKDYLDKNSVMCGGEPQPVSITSSILELKEQEKILHSIIENEN